MMDQATALLRFYAGQGVDHQARTIEQIWEFSHFWLEHTHDYIQWLFPIPEVGRFNHFAPQLGEMEQVAFADSSALRARQCHSLDMMLNFFALTRDGVNIGALPTLNIREHIWLKRAGHNHLRISRMIRSLHMCAQPELAYALQQAVITIGTTQGCVSEQSIQYWKAATTRS